MGQRIGGYVMCVWGLGSFWLEREGGSRGGTSRLGHEVRENVHVRLFPAG